MFDLSDTPEARKKLVEQLDSLVKSVRDNQKSVLERWLLIHHAWKGSHTRSFYKSDTFNHFIPYFRRSIERFVVRAAQMVLPTNEFCETHPADEFNDASGKAAESVQAYLLYLLRKKIRIYSIVKQLFRTKRLYGRAILKTNIKVVKENGKDKVWPTARVVDPFMFLYWPETSNQLDDSQLIIEDSLISWDEYQSDVARGRADSIDEKDLITPKWPDHITRRLQVSGLSEPKSLEPTEGEEEGKRKRLTDWVHRSEIWVKQDRGWRFLWVVWNLKDGAEVVRLPKKTFPRHSYRLSTAREIPGEQHSTSQGDDQEPLQVILNDQINMASEGQAIQLAPPVACDPSIGRVASVVYRPRAKWLVPPEGIKQMEFKDTTKAAFQGIHFTVGMMDSFSGSSPLAEGQPIRNLPRAGFAVSSLLSMSLSDIRDEARDMEDDILTPMLSDLHSLTVQFVPPTQIALIPGTREYPPKALEARDISGEYDFVWVGSLQSEDLQVKGERLMAFVGALGKIAQFAIPDLQARGKRINWLAIFKRAWRYSLGERGADSILEDIEQAAPSTPEVGGTSGVSELERLLRGGGL